MSEVKNDIQEEERERKTDIPKEAIEHREYQIAIAEKCTGKNSLVVLPTGLGKTIIAVLVALNTLKIVPTGSKIIVMAPTRPLINQHYDSFLDKLRIPKNDFGILTGKIPPEKRGKIFREREVLFFTPQTLRNDLVSGRYSLKNVCLLVIDEAHHASGDYPYVTIADKFVEQNSDGSILALTASPGATKEKITTLCNLLHVPLENIHMRSRKDEDVKSYLKPMDIYKIGVEKTQLMRESLEEIEQVLEERLLYLAQQGFIPKESNPLRKKIMRKDLVKLNAELIDLVQSDGDKTGVYGAISVNAQALILYHMIELVEQQGPDMLLEYIDKLHSDARKKNSSKAVKNLASNQQVRKIYVELRKYSDFYSEKLVHPKYHVLEAYLTREIQTNPESRILVFIKLRNSVLNIVKKLNKSECIKASRFVGQATKSKKDIGLSQKNQIQILQEFKQGKYNTLVATNVAEEGLDIAECDLVVFYDVVASEIRLIQRKGRTARHRKGKVVILYTKNSRDEIYLNVALNRLKKMNFNLKNSNRFLSEFNDQNQMHPDISTKKKNLFNSPQLEMEKEDQDRAHIIQDHPKTDIKSCVQRKQEKHPKQSSLEDFTTDSAKKDPLIEQMDFTISKCLPMKLGLRKKLTKLNISYVFVDSQEHIVIGKNVLVQIYSGKSIDLSEIEKKEKKFKEKYELVLNILDLSEFVEEFDGQKRLLKRKVVEFAIKRDLRIICVDDHEELFFILRNIHDHNINTKKGI